MTLDEIRRPPPVCRLSDLCDVMGWSDSLASAFCRSGKITGAYKLGRRWFIPRSTIDALSSGAVQNHAQESEL